MSKSRFNIKLTPGSFTSKAKLDLYPRFEKFKSKKRKVKRKKNE